MFKWFIAFLAFVIINVLLGVLTLATPFITIYAIFALFKKQKSSGGLSLLTNLAKTYATNKSKLNQSHKEARGASIDSIRRPEPEQGNNKTE